MILFLALILRFRDMLNRDFWYDEAFTGVTVKSNFWEMIRITINDVHPPLYYIALKIFAYPFDYSVFGIRLFSVIFGILGVWAIYLFTKEVFNRKAALFSSFIAAVSPFAIQYSQEGRMYSMFSFFIVIAVYFLVKGLKTEKYSYYILWGIFAGFSFLTHYMGVIFSILYYFVYVIYKFNQKEKTENKWKMAIGNILPDKRMFAGYFSALLIFSFWIKIFISHLLYSGLNNMHWVKPVSFIDIFTNIQIFIIGSPLGDLSSGMPAPNGLNYISSSSILIGVTLLFGFLIPSFIKKEKEEKYFVLVFSFGFMLMIYCLSLFGENYFVSRYLIAASYFVFIFLGVWLSNVDWKAAVSSLAIYFFILVNIVNSHYPSGYGELAENLDKYKNNNFYVLNSFDYVIAKYYVGENHLILYNIDWPQYNPSSWAAIGQTLKRTENYDDLKNDPNALILANIQKDREKRNDKNFDPAGLPLVAKYDNITIYKPSN
ncbi:MAG: glycosyltransferase family 39 protein [bacterium]|nr:glycosyltransferase family 39 protein [bacterium]